MHPQRRAKFFGLVVILSVLIILYITSGARQTQNSEFYRRTSAALEKHAAQAAKEAEDVARAQTDVKGRLKEAEQAAKQAANIKGAETGPAKGDTTNAQKPSPPYGQAVLTDGEEASAGSRHTGGDGVAPIGNTGQTNSKSGDSEETDEEHAVEVEMNSILKKGPSKLAISGAISAANVIVSYSHHILQDVLSSLPQSEANTARKIQNHSSAVCCGVRRTSSRRTTTSLVSEEHPSEDSTKHPHQRLEHRRWRRH